MLRALEGLGAALRVDARRVLVLRTASDYTMQTPGMSAVDVYFDPCPTCPDPAVDAHTLTGSHLQHLSPSSLFGFESMINGQGMRRRWRPPMCKSLQLSGKAA